MSSKKNGLSLKFIILNPLKILWQAYDRENYTAGPIVNSVRLLPELKKRGYEVYAIIGNDGSGHPNADLLADLGITVFNYVKPAYSKDHVAVFLDYAAKIKPDIFVSNVSIQAGFAGRWIRKWGIPVVHTIRSEDANNIGTASFFFGKKSEWNLDALVSVNSYLLNLIKDKSEVKFKHAIIPSGVVINDSRIDFENNESLNVIYTGRFVQKQKRILDLLNSFVLVAKKHARIQFTLMGSGDKSITCQMIEEIAKNNLTQRIKVLERKCGDAYKEELTKHHVIVLMSDYEGIPGALMDGMSCGLIPVSLNINGIKELIVGGVNGFIISDRLIDFENCLKLILRNTELRRELSKNAVATIRENFSLEHATDLWEKLFLKLPVQTKNVRFLKVYNLPPWNETLLEHNTSEFSIKRAKRWILRKIRVVIKPATF